MKKNLAKKITLSILAGAVLMSSSVVWAGSVFVTQPEGGGTDSFYLGFKESGSTAIQGDYNFAVGSGAKMEIATKSVAIGTNAEINNASGSVALGYGSIASASNVVSVGSGKSADASTYQYRKIVNVADGEADHDAATVGQMERYVISAVAGKANATDVANTYATKAETQTALDGKADKAETLAGYGITNAFTKDEVNNKLGDYAKTTDVANTYATKAETQTALDGKANKATTLEGYGIIDAYTKTEVDNLIGDSSAAISGINQRLEKTNAKINKVGAGGAALAALHPLDYDPDDKLTFSAGMGNYAGENAAALGAFYRPNEKFMVSLGGTMGNGENMVNLGLSIGLDKPNGFAKMSKRELIQEVNAVKAENEAMKAEMAEMKAMLQELLAKK